MARVARGKGIQIEVPSFEEWDPAGRTFDLVTAGGADDWVAMLATFSTINAWVGSGSAVCRTRFALRSRTLVGSSRACAVSTSGRRDGPRQVGRHADPAASPMCRES